ncbi:MAG: nuclear transport factor 2 family protein [Acidobacteriota bacterium]
MLMTSAIDVALRFVDRINARDTDGIATLMTKDHKFIDSLGTEIVGREKTRHGWREYFRVVPDYHVEVRQTFADGQVVVLLGAARGTYSRNGTLRVEDAWVTPAAWRALVAGNQVAEWQVYADNEPMRRRISANSA